MLNNFTYTNIGQNMEPINDIMEQQSLHRQLVEESSNDLMVGHHVLVGGSASPASVLSGHDTMVDETEISSSSGIVLGSSMSHQSALLMMGDSSPSHQDAIGSRHVCNQSYSASHALDHQRLVLGSPIQIVETDSVINGISGGSSCSNGSSGHIINVKKKKKLILLGTHHQKINNINNNNNNHIYNSDSNKECSLNLDVIMDAMSGTEQQNYESENLICEKVRMQRPILQHQNQMLHIQTYDREPHHSSSHHHHDHNLQINEHLSPDMLSRHMHERGRQIDSAVTTTHIEPLSVIVQAQDDSHDSTSQILSPELGVVVGVENSLETSSYQTLSSVVNEERISPAAFSPNSAYATLTPLQPLPPISTMSEKFAYGGRITSSDVSTQGNTTNTQSEDNEENNNNNNNSNNVVNNSTSGDGQYEVVPATHSHVQQDDQHQQQPHYHRQNLCSLSLSGLSGSEASSYLTYDKLPSMCMSITPPPNFTGSPTHTLSGIVVTCDLPSHSPVGDCGPLSPQSTYSQSTDINSPSSLNHCVCRNLHHPCGGSSIKCRSNRLNKSPGGCARSSKRQVICLSPVTEQVIVTGYESPFGTHQRELLVNTISSTTSSNSGGRNSSQFQLHPHSPGTISSNSLSASSLHSPGVTVATLAQMGNGTINSLSANDGNSALVNVTHISHDQEPLLVSIPPSSSSPSSHHQLEVNATATTTSATTASKNSGTLMTSHIALVTNANLALNPDPCDAVNSINSRTTMQHNLNSQVCISHSPHEHTKLLPYECGETDDNATIRESEIRIRQQEQQQHFNNIQKSSKIQSKYLDTEHSGDVSTSVNSTINLNGDTEEINTKELAQRISAELKRYSIPQAIFAQRVLCRSQGTLSDLLRNPKPWSKLKSGRETFRRMFKWLQEPEFQRMSALRMAAAQIPQRNNSSLSSTNNNPILNHNIVNKNSSGPTISSIVTTLSRRKDEPLQIEHMAQPKKPRLVFTDLQRRTLQAIFKETKRPSKEMQVTIARQLGLEPTTVGNFFMNARRRSMDKWRDDDGGGGISGKNSTDHHNNKHHTNNGNQLNKNSSNRNSNRNHHQSAQNLHLDLSTSPSPGNGHSLELDDDADINLDLEQNDFQLDGDNDDDLHKSDDML
uniref:One cut domain family member n=1 Tax=Glossina brevipalpis TaxID=37001 RepID=A0A1A9WYE3_9MUSC